MTTFFLICAARHALQDRILLGRMNVALDAKGRADAERLSRFLAGRIKAIAVQSSPRTRALQTAVTIARALHCPVEVAPEMDELDTGEWTGRSFDELATNAGWLAWNSERGSSRPPSGESTPELQRRIVSHLQELSAKHPDDAIVIVTHAEGVRSALLHFLDRSLNESTGIEIGPASVSTIVIRDGSGKVLAMNELCPATQT